MVKIGLEVGPWRLLQIGLGPWYPNYSLAILFLVLWTLPELVPEEF